MAEDDIPVSAAMMEAGCAEWPFSDVWHFGSYDDVCAIYRAMERMRRAEADAEVIRRSVKEFWVHGSAADSASVCSAARLPWLGVFAVDYRPHGTLPT